MRVEDLNREQIKELKQNYYCNDLGNNASYGELADIDNIVTDKEIFEYFKDTDFTDNDFFCSVDMENDYIYDLDIRKDLEDSIDMDFTEFVDNFNDLQILRLANELLKNARDRLDNDLDNLEIKTEYNKLYDTTNNIDSIIQNYK